MRTLTKKSTIPEKGRAPKAFPIAVIMESLVGGGIEKVAINLAKSLADKGYKIDIVLLLVRGDFRDAAFSRFSFYCAGLRLRLRDSSFGLLRYFRKQNVSVHWLTASPLSRIFGRFALRRQWPNVKFNSQQIRRASRIRKYIHRRNPKVILAQGPIAIQATLGGCSLANTSPSIAATIHSAPQFWDPYGQSEMHTMLLKTDHVICVSQGVAESAIRRWKIDRKKVSIIYNPFDPDISRLSKAEVDHPWFGRNTAPVILAVGRISPEKDFSTLLSSFALVCKERDARLVIISPQGKSKAVNPLISQANELGVLEKVDILGFDQNPYRYMRQSSCFVLSTRYEGFGLVLSEALACGTPVVSSDAPYGPSEILEGGKWGKLVPVGDAPAMARAILETLDGDRPSASELVERSRFFSTERATAEYEALIDRLTGGTPSPPA